MPNFSTIAVDKLFVPVSGSNCEADYDNVLLDMASLSQVKSKPTMQLFRDTDAESLTTCELMCEDDFDMEISVF